MKSCNVTRHFNYLQCYGPCSWTLVTGANWLWNVIFIFSKRNLRESILLQLIIRNLNLLLNVYCFYIYIHFPKIQFSPTSSQSLVLWLPSFFGSSVSSFHLLFVSIILLNIYIILVGAGASINFHLTPVALHSESFCLCLKLFICNKQL